MGLPISPPEPRAEYVVAENRLQRYIDRYAKRCKDFEALTAYGENETQPGFTYLAIANAGLDRLCNERIRALDDLLGSIPVITEIDDADKADWSGFDEITRLLAYVGAREASCMYFEKHALVLDDENKKSINDLRNVLAALGCHAESISEEYDQMQEIRRFPL